MTNAGGYLLSSYGADTTEFEGFVGYSPGGAGVRQGEPEAMPLPCHYTDTCHLNPTAPGVQTRVVETYEYRKNQSGVFSTGTTLEVTLPADMYFPIPPDVVGDTYFTSMYSPRVIFGEAQHHGGVDIGAVTGTPIVAPGDALIIAAGASGWSSGYGTVVAGRFVVDGEVTDNAFLLAHMNALANDIIPVNRFAGGHSQYVKKGDVVGYVGSTGRSEGPHLHFEIRVGPTQDLVVNPLLSDYATALPE